MKTATIFFLFFLMLPAALAFDCNLLEGKEKELCEEIGKLAVTEEEKDLLISDIFYSGKEYPNHDFVYYWNTKLNIEKAPEGIKTENEGYIKNAWLKILAVMPSVLEYGQLLCSDKGKILTKYNYDIEIPTSTKWGDCRTEYEPYYEKANLKIYLNNNLIGYNEITSFNTNKDASFKAVLNIEQKTKIHRYKWNEYCCREEKKCEEKYCKTKNGRKICYKKCKTYCAEYCKKCEYSYTEFKTNSLTLTDTFKAKYYDKTPETIFEVTNQYYDISEGFLNATKFSSLILEFKDAFYQNHQYYYDLVYSFKPYYVLTIRANKYLTEKVRNIRITNNDPEFGFVVENPQDCNIKVSDHFKGFSQKCDTNFQKIEVELNTDKLTYSDGETIKVSVTPKDQKIKLSYADKTVYAYGNAEFQAELYNNRITAELGNVKTSKAVYVSNSSNWSLIIHLLFFLLLIYLVVKLFDKKWRFLP